VEPNLRRQRARRHIVRPAEGRKEVIQRRLVSHVDGGKRKTPFVMIALEQVVVAHGKIEQVTRRNTRRIPIIVLGVDRWDLDKAGSELRCQAGGRQRCRRGGVDSIADESGLEFLVGTQGVSEPVLQQDGRLSVESG